MSTGIEWTDETWNPVTGCSKVSAGCTNCYAEKLSHRFKMTTKPWNAAFAAENVKLHPERLDQPLRWQRPRRVFVNSMSDLFHEQVPFEFIEQVFATMVLAQKHTFQILTKRPERMLKFFKTCDFNPGFREHTPLPNVWLGVSVENQEAADQRIPLLLQTPAAVRFLSCEPLLGPLDLTARRMGLECESCAARVAHWCGDPVINWVIAGGESGPNARPMHPDWARSLRDQCYERDVPFFFKQHGEFTNPGTADIRLSDCDDRTDYQFDDGILVWRVGKMKAGRLLDGCTWDEFPGTGGEHVATTGR